MESQSGNRTLRAVGSCGSLLAFSKHCINSLFSPKFRFATQTVIHRTYWRKLNSFFNASQIKSIYTYNISTCIFNIK